MTICANPTCTTHFEPRTFGGKAQVYCSPKCRSADAKGYKRRATQRYRAALSPEQAAENRRKRNEQNKQLPGPKLNAQLMSRYGITLDEYNRLLAAQNHCCAICGKPESDYKRKNLSVDHCHDTGKVRGLLCNQCNMGIGQLNDDYITTQRAAAYLMKSAGFYVKF